MTNPEQKGRALRKSEQAKLERQEVTPGEASRGTHDEPPSDADALPAVSHEKQPPAPPPAAEKLELPKGAMLAIRKSGGIKFSSRDVVVYPDGRVTYGGGDTAKTALESRAVRKMNDAQVMRMRRLLDQFFRMQPPPGKQSPDAMAYEIVARVGSKSNQMEVYDGSIPDALMPLIEQLNRLMPSEDD